MTGTRDETIDASLWPGIREWFVQNMDECASRIPKRITNQRARDDLDRFCSYRYSIWQIDYSMGEELTRLAPEFENLLETWIPVMSSSVVWSDSTRLLSIARLLGHGQFLQDFWPTGAVSARIQSDPVRLGQWFADNPDHRKYGHGSSTGSDLSGRTWKLIEASEADPSAAEGQLQSYMDDWYELAHDYSWWGSHIGRRGKAPTSYVGYWCWEAAAIASKCGVNDSHMKPARYYPYELAHYLD